MILAVMNAIYVIAYKEALTLFHIRSSIYEKFHISLHIHSSQAYQNPQMTSSQLQWLHSSVGRTGIARSCVHIYREYKNMITHGRTRPVSLCLRASDRKSDCEKYTTVITKSVKQFRIDSIGHGRTRPLCSGVYLTDRKSDCQKLVKGQKTCLYLVIKV